MIQWGESAYAEERYICTQVLFAQLFPGASESLTSMCDRLVLDSSERDDRHGALLDADITADALILLERQLKHGESGAPRSWTSQLTDVTTASVSDTQPMRRGLSGRPPARHPREWRAKREQAILAPS